MAVEESSLEETIKLLGWHTSNLVDSNFSSFSFPPPPKLKATDPDKFLIGELHEILRSYHDALLRTKAENTRLDALIESYDSENNFTSTISDQTISDQSNSNAVRRRFLGHLQDIFACINDR